MENYYIVSFSGGKDSTAMLLHLMELGQPIDEVLYCDTYMEFPAMERHIEKIRKVVEDQGIKFTVLKNENSFEYYMYEYLPKRKNPEKFIEKYGSLRGGFSFPNIHNRWCTGTMKTRIIDKYLKEKSKQHNLRQYIGLAADETERLKRKCNQNPTHIHPLVEWGWTEKQCLEYCYSLGYDWEGLYNIFSRVSCWMCPLQRLEELRKLKKHFPELWDQLLEMDKKCYTSFKGDYSVADLGKRFDFEEQRIAEGKSIRNREFFNELKILLNKEGN